MAQRWIMPGEDVTIGDGWVVEMPGIVITSAVGLSGRTVSLTAQIELLCGCPITPNGPWKASDYAATASLWQEGARIAGPSWNFRTAQAAFQECFRHRAGSGFRSTPATA